MPNGRHRGGHGGNRVGPGIPNPRPVRYYTDDGRLDPALVDELAQKRAEEFRALKSTQLRRFFDEVQAIRRQWELEAGKGKDPDEAFSEVRARFAMLKARGVYAKGRMRREIPDAFVQFLVDHVHAVKTARDFQAFLRHFEAVVAFHKYLARE
ncbi:MAG TPA: type III-A CRISPR-associated protein Csm2 [Chromatiales bacterium]|nr:type III-A CRISPR-associated protein Csm2 [Chromatiales bacterium]